VSRMKLLIVDDDRDLVDLLAFSLERAGFETVAAHDAPSAIGLIKAEHPDLIVLDINLGAWSGLDLLQDLRKTSQIPVVLLTARGREEGKVAGLDLGADDYVTKPFSHRELRARIRAQFRRGQGSADGEVHRFGACELDMARFELRRDGRQVEATHTELKLLAAFVRGRGRVQTRELLLDQVWGSGVYLTDRVVDNHVVALRKKIEDDPAAPKYLISIRGVGYRFDG
jgi:DNA-binding response OmpR family regulator